MEGGHEFGTKLLNSFQLAAKLDPLSLEDGVLSAFRETTSEGSPGGRNGAREKSPKFHNRSPHPSHRGSACFDGCASFQRLCAVKGYSSLPPGGKKKGVGRGGSMSA